MLENLAQAESISKPIKGPVRRFLEKPLRSAMLALLYAQTLVIPAASWVQESGNQSTNEYLVDVIIHKSLPQQSTEDWIKDTVNNYSNRRLAEAGAKQRVRTNQIFRDFDEENGCESIPGAIPHYDRCRFEDGKVRVWLYAQGYITTSPKGRNLFTGTSADSESAQIFQSLHPNVTVEVDGYYGQRVNGDIFNHEFGHLLGAPDYYNEVVNATLNKVAPIAIGPFVRDIMFNQSNYYNYSETTQHYFDQVSQLPIGSGNPYWVTRYTPKETILKITDNEGTALNNVKVELFPQQRIVEGNFIRNIIQDIPTIVGNTNNEGQFLLGNYYDMFHTTRQPLDITGGYSAFMRITNGEDIRYTAISRSYLNYLYFNGQNETAIVTVPFSSFFRIEDQEDSRPHILTAPGVTVQ